MTAPTSPSIRVPGPSVSPAPTALDVVGVSKRFGDCAAVNDVSFALGRGEFLTMLGPSGSGKTTTLNLIAGFARPDAGSIVVGGRDISVVPPHKRNIGMVFQNYALFPHMTAAANVAFPLRMRERRSKRALAREVDAALELVGLRGCGGRRPSELSGGQQQRVAVARAIVFKPDLLLMDEPLGALDRKLRGSMQVELLRIARETSATVISVTHDQEEALVMSDRIAIYNGGRIEQLGSAQDLYERPASVFVADFIGDSNIFHGVIRRDGSRVVVEGDGWWSPVPPSAPACDDGDAAALVLRPEDVAVAAGELPEGEPNRRGGAITEAIYLGSEWKYLVDVPGGSVQVRVRRADATTPLAPGTRVVLSWSPDDGVVLRDRPTTGDATAIES